MPIFFFRKCFPGSAENRSSIIESAIWAPVKEKECKERITPLFLTCPETPICVFLSVPGMIPRILAV